MPGQNRTASKKRIRCDGNAGAGDAEQRDWFWWDVVIMQKPEYEFDVDGHTVVKGERKERKATTPGWMSQALNEGDGVYRPWAAPQNEPTAQGNT